jgi:tetratricopeptide (TPR) repeat protein
VRRLRADPARRRPAGPPAPPGYEVLSELGRGGMGVVYKARQTALKRLVALKVIATGAWAGPDVVARFRAEAEAVAQLQHPNIVQVYEIGECEGRPFFSLEYLEGGSLADRLDGTPLPPRAAAELLRTLALAMHAAHERGIVHRDLKPANVLLSLVPGPLSLEGDQGQGTRDKGPIPKIADFGLAKRLGGDSGLTQTGAVLGTPSYMAPEQARGQVHTIGPAADVYALGAILYECLTGRPPFTGATSLETIQQVQSQTPVAPTRLQPQVPRDLETICLKCLEKEPHRRYPSAWALAEDLRHFLAGEPILARPATLRERAWKWAKRRPAVAALLSLLLLLFLVLVVVWGRSYVQLKERATQLKEQATRLEEQATRLKERNEFAQGVVEDMYTNVAEEWLADEPEKDPLQKEFLGKALKFYQQLTQEDDTDPKARRRAGLAYFRVGQLYRTLKEHEKAADAYRQAIALQDQLLRQFPDEPDYRQDLANSYNWRGELRRDGGSLEDAEPDFREAMRLQEGLPQGGDAAKPAYRRELARSLSNLGLVEMDTGRPGDAWDHFDRAVGLLEGLEREGPTPDFRHELARTLTNRGVFHHTHKRLEKAEADYRRAIELLKKLRGTGRGRVIYAYNLAIAYQDLGNSLIDRHQYDAALTELGSAQAILARLVEDFPLRPRYKKKLGRTYLGRGSALEECKRLREAEANWKEAEKHFRWLAEQYPQEAEHQADLGKCEGNLGLLRFDQEDWPAARDYFKEAVGRLKAALDRNRERIDYREALRDHCQNLAETLVCAGEHEAAVEVAGELAAVFPEQPLGHYYAACFVARCVPLAEKEGDKARHAEQARKLLEEALEKVLRGSERLKRLPEKEEKRIFGPLARRDGWPKLLERLEALPRPEDAKPAP